MNRRQIRENVFKLLFRMEFHKDQSGYEQRDIDDQFGMFQYEMNQDENLQAKETFSADMDYISEKYHAIMSKIPEIDDSINAVTTGWKTSRMAKVDLCILRLAVYEISSEDDIPEKVSINEAVELAKKYGTADSASFVNGVLGKYVRSRNIQQ